MKTTLTLVVSGCLLAANLCFGQSGVYMYHLSTPITGRLVMWAKDATTGISAHTDLNLTNLAEAVYLDTAATRIRQVGFVLVTPPSASLVIQETQYVAGVPVPGTVTVNITPDGGGLHFDTGPVIMFGGGKLTVISIQWDVSLSAVRIPW